MQQMWAPPLQLLWMTTYVLLQRDLPTAIALVLFSIRFSLQKAGFFITAEPEGQLNYSQYGGIFFEGPQQTTCLGLGSCRAGCCAEIEWKSPVTLPDRCCLQLNLLTFQVNIHIYNN